jgi:hypothetical protein
MLSQDMTVKGCRPAARRRFSPATIRPKAVFGVARVVHDVRMCRVETLRGWRNVVAAFGHGQRHDADLGTGEAGEHRLDGERLDEVDHRAGDPQGRGARLLLDHGRQPVLRAELLPHVDVRLAHARADERPVVVEPGVEQVV